MGWGSAEPILFEKVDKTVNISIDTENGTVNIYKLPFDFLESIWDVVRDLAKSWEKVWPERSEGKRWYGSAKILMNGDVIYTKPETNFFIDE